MKHVSVREAQQPVAAGVTTRAALVLCPACFAECKPEERWPAGLLDRIKAAEQRVQDNRAPRSIPADPHSDVDLVLAEVRYLIEGNWPPFWIQTATRVPPLAVPDNCKQCDRQLRLDGLCIECSIPYGPDVPTAPYWTAENDSPRGVTPADGGEQ